MDKKGLDAARAYSLWHLGYADWADSILEAYFNPDGTLERLAKERGDEDDE